MARRLSRLVGIPWATTIALATAWLGNSASAQWQAVPRGDAGAVSRAGCALLVPPIFDPRPIPWGVRQVAGVEPVAVDDVRTTGREALAAIPLNRLTPTAQKRIEAISSRPTLYRHLTQKSIRCDPELFLCLVRNPEILVGTWELMGITQVQTRRLDAYQMEAVDGSGTTCTVDLVYGDSAVHVYVAEGFYDGKMAPNKINGKGLFVLRSSQEVDAAGNPVIRGSLDCFLQIDQVAVDLLLRTFGPLIGRAADHNFNETARFIDQLGQSAERNPEGLEELAMKMPQVSEATRQQFITQVRHAARRYHERTFTTPVKFGGPATAPGR
jgi:hypothetical protein